MSAPVDVLAVMDELRKTYDIPGIPFPSRKRADAARAAVAELIEAAIAVERHATRHTGDERMFDRLYVALARVQP